MHRVVLAAAAAVLPILACDRVSPVEPAEFVPTANAVANLTLEPSVLRLVEGRSATLVLRDAGQPVATSAIVWRSSDTTVARISATGLVRAAAPGTALILAAAGSRFATASVTVDPRPLPKLARPPELPRTTVDTRPPAQSGRVIRVPAGGDLQMAIDSARAGDVLELPAGATFEGAFTLPPKSGSGWITIRSSAHEQLPEGTRVRPRDARRMARLQGGHKNKRVLLTQAGARNWRFVGLEIALADEGLPALVNTIVELTNGSSNIIFDRTWIHGTPTQGLQRCVVMNSAMTAIINSRLDDCHARGFDSQAIVGWNGPGPYRIENNYLAGAGENIMFGGAAIRDGSVPADIEIRRNHIVKPPEWRGVWTVKNAFELKIAERVLFEGNVIENVWADAQVGFAINLKSENRDVASRPGIATRDVTIRNNLIINARYGATIIAGGSNTRTTGQGTTERVLFENNIFDLYDARAFQLGGGVDEIFITRNSLSPEGRTLIEGDAGRLLFTGNVSGMAKGSGVREGTLTFDRFDNYDVAGNAFVGRPPDAYPPGNYFPATTAQVPSSIGANRALVDQLTAGVRQ